MSALKERRTLLGYTQKQVAKKLNTTQQTVARWESGTDIPNTALKDLALMLECSIDELLGVKSWQAQRMKKGQARKEDELPFGTLALSTEAGNFEYPISEAEHNRITGVFGGTGLNGADKWLEFSTMNNMMVFCQADTLREVRMVSDEIDAMPDFAPQAVYSQLSQRRNEEEIGPLMRKEVLRLARTLAPKAKRDEDALVTARDRLHTVNLHCRRGGVLEAPLTDAVATSLAIIANGGDGANVFVAVSDGPDESAYANLSHIALVEVPLVVMTAFWASDDASDGAPT
jgi:transcriptional regulator with XRE-family HTH domain